MLDSYTKTTSNTHNKFNFDINAVSGTLRKSHPDSIMASVSINSALLDLQNPRYIIKKWMPYSTGSGGYEHETPVPITVLQVMLCGDNTAIVEFILKEKDGQPHDSE